MGPPFVDMPGFGELTWGIASAPLRTDPPGAEADALKNDPGIHLPGLEGLPVLVVTGSASPAAPGGAAVARFLQDHGARVVLLPLAEAGVIGNGHGVMFEANSEASIQPVLTWLGEVDR
jgi:hypothetical protein